jgi:hypothetical protein
VLTIIFCFPVFLSFYSVFFDKIYCHLSFLQEERQLFLVFPFSFLFFSFFAPNSSLWETRSLEISWKTENSFLKSAWLCFEFFYFISQKIGCENLNTFRSRSMSHRANRKTVKKLIQVRRGVEHEVPSSEDSDDDAVVPPSTPPRVKRLSDDSKVDTGISQLSSVAFQTPTVVHSPCLTETPKRIKKSSPPKHELPVFALPSAAHDSSLQSNAIVKEVSASTISAAKAPPDVSTPHLPAVVHDMQPLSPTLTTV